MKLSALRSLLTPSLLLAAACGGGDDDGPLTPEGEYYPMVVDSVVTPASSAEASDLGLDIDGNGRVDNQLGMVLATLGTQGLEVKPQLEEAVATGSLVLLAEVQTTDFTSAPAAGLTVYIGDPDQITPAPCTDDTMLDTCGQHLMGTGSFAISADSPTNGTVAGPFVGGRFNGGPGQVRLQLSLTEGAAPVNLDLIGARAELRGVSADGITDGIIAGAITEEDINTKVLPAVVELLVPSIEEDCEPVGAECNCVADSTGDGVLALFDDNDDCMVTVMEIQENGLVGTLLAPDVVIDGKPSISLGVGISAKKATFSRPGT